MNVKVQIKGKISVRAMLERSKGLQKLTTAEDIQNLYLTFIAFSSEMKSRVLEMMAKNPQLDIKLSLTELNTVGEWYEE